MIAPVQAHLFRVDPQHVANGKVIEEYQNPPAGALDDRLYELGRSHGEPAAKGCNIRAETAGAIEGNNTVVRLPVLLPCQCLIFIERLVLVSEPLIGDASTKHTVEKSKLHPVGVLGLVKKHQRKAHAQTFHQGRARLDSPMSQRDHIGETIVAIICNLRLKLLKRLAGVSVPAGLLLKPPDLKTLRRYISATFEVIGKLETCDKTLEGVAVSTPIAHQSLFRRPSRKRHRSKYVIIDSLHVPA